LINPKTNEKKNAILRNTISLSYNTWVIKIIPDHFEVVNNKQITILPQKKGTTIIKILYWTQVIKKIPIIIQ
jgi:hypothetical protein